MSRAAAAAALKVNATAIAEGAANLREVALTTLDDAVHGYPISEAPRAGPVQSTV